MSFNTSTEPNETSDINDMSKMRFVDTGEGYGYQGEGQSSDSQVASGFFCKPSMFPLDIYLVLSFHWEVLWGPVPKTHARV